MGIIDGVQAPAVRAAQAAPPQAAAQRPPQQQRARGGGNLAVERVVEAGRKALYEPKVMEAILALIRKAPDPAMGLAQAVVHLVGELVRKSKNTIPQEAKTPAGRKLMADIAELAEAAGLIENAAQAIRQASAMIAQELMKAARGAQQSAPGAAPQTSRQASPQAAVPQPIAGVPA